MAEAILDNASFQLIRTNPKLTTNIKIVVDSSGKLYLESFDANEILSNSVYKAVAIDPKSTYDKDIASFYSIRNTPKEIAYSIKQNSDNSSVLSTYDSQYEMFYASGTEAITSESYTEDLGILAPLWIEDYIPNYFIIFRIDNPAAFNMVGQNNADEGIIEATTSINFTQNVLNSCTAIKTFDLTGSSDLGRYIRNYKNQQTFPESPFFLNLQSDQMTQYRGISYADGRFVDKGEILYKEFYSKDKSIIEQEYFISNGFERNSVIVANILNLQYLFTDTTSSDFSINRYFGLYANMVEEGSFKIDGNSFYTNSANEKTQTPKLPSIDSLEKLNYYSMNNPNGLVLYYQPDSLITKTGELSPSIADELESIFVIKDKQGSIHTVKKGSDWDSNSIRLSDTDVNISDFSGYTPSVGFFDTELLKGKAKSSVSWTISGEIPLGYTINFYDNNNFTLTLESNATLVNSKIGPNSLGKSYQYFFNGQGQPKDIALSIASALNYYKQGERFFNAVAQDDKVIFFSRFGGTRFNNLNFELDSTIGEISELTIFPKKFTTSTGNIANKFYFTGGSDYQESRARVDISLNSTILGKYTDVKSNGKSECIDYGLYLDEPVFDINGSPKEFKKITSYISACFDENSIKTSKSGGLSIYDLYEIKYGRLSIFPLKDFDFDFYSSQYSEEGELAEEYDHYNQNVKLVNSSNQILLVPVNQSSYPNIMNFYKNGGFTKLQPVLENTANNNQEETFILSEYDRLFENFNKNLALFSRITPFVCKWVYNNGNDVRNKPYRLNFSEAFGIYNFSPSPLSNKQDPLSFSHEWYYLSQVPTYFSEDGLMNSWSYFNFTPDDNINNNLGFFQNVTTDNFSNFFIVDNLQTLSNTPSFAYFDKQIRYSRMKGGNSQNYAQSFFRGVRIIAKERVEAGISLNYNLNSIKTLKNSNFNDYKFAAILIPTTRSDKPNFQIKVINNKKWKTITLLIFLKINYPEMQPGSTSIVDRTLLYNLQSIISAGNFKIGNSTLTTFNPNIESVITNYYPSPISSYSPASYSSVKMTGWINPLISTGSIGGTYDIKGVGTKFLTEIIKGNNGLFDDITFNVFPNVYQISKIIKIENDGLLKALSFKINGVDANLPINGASLINFKNGYYSVIGGGYEELINRMNLASFANIYNMINNGAPEVIYETVNENGQLSYNNFILELSTGSLDMKASYLRYVVDSNKPTLFNLQDVVGYEFAVSKTPGVLPIYRQPGNYNIKFTNLFKFKDPYIENVIDNNLQLTSYQQKTFNLCRYKNTQFDSSYINFGQIRNYFFHKVSPTNPGAVLELSSDTSFNSVYPLIGEVAIDKHDKFYIFSSSWDPGYFVTYFTKTNKVLSPGTLSSLEKKSFFGSKYLKVPQSIIIDTFDSTEFVYFYSSENTLNITLDLQSRFIRYYIEKIYNLFLTYVNPAFTSYSHTDIEQFIKSYIQINIIPLYKIQNIDMYLKEIAGGSDDFSWMDKTNSIKSEQGLIIDKNFGIQNQNTNNLNFDIIYRKKLGYSTTIGVSIILTKK